MRPRVERENSRTSPVPSFLQETVLFKRCNNLFPKEPSSSLRRTRRRGHFLPRERISGGIHLARDAASAHRLITAFVRRCRGARTQHHVTMSFPRRYATGRGNSSIDLSVSLSRQKAAIAYEERDEAFLARATRPTHSLSLFPPACISRDRNNERSKKCTPRRGRLLLRARYDLKEATRFCGGRPPQR